MSNARVGWTAGTFLSLCLALVPSASGANPAPLAGTRPLTWKEDPAERMLDGIDRFLLRKTEQTIATRRPSNPPDLSKPEVRQAWLAERRERLRHVIGLRDERTPDPAMRPGPSARFDEPDQAVAGLSFRVHAVQWPVMRGVNGEGLLLIPEGEPVANVIVLPDADQTPEQLAGIAPGLPRRSMVAALLAGHGGRCRVLIPALINRERVKRRRAMLTQREFVYRPSYVLGRHIVGYEVQKLLAAVDWFAAPSASDGPPAKDEMKRLPIGLFGYGEGGQLALLAAALDERIAAAVVSGYIDDRRDLWRQPIDRNLFGFLKHFDDAQLCALVAPRPLLIEAAAGPAVTIPGEGGAPGRLRSPAVENVRAEVAAAREWMAGMKPEPVLELFESDGGQGAFGSFPAVARFLGLLAPGQRRQLVPWNDPDNREPLPLADAKHPNPLLQFREKVAGLRVDPAARHARQLAELIDDTQHLLTISPEVRADFLGKLDTRSLAHFQASQRFYRDYFAEEVIGQFPDPLLPANARSRRIFDEPAYTGYEVALDVWQDVVAYGYLLIPKNIPPGERRPVVVCQHGLEGRPRDVADPSVQNKAYHQYGCRLAEQGYIVFAPQNPYLLGDRFRTLQRKANPLGCTLFSIIVPQHRQITAWLAGLPMVDSDRIAFYGLSYGGKTAMRVPALVDRYALSICSADFNDWVWKNASTRAPHSYVWHGEYEIFEYNLGGTFNYSEMAALIAPRPFMVERGHFDGVAPDERVGLEFAKVRNLYAARLKLSDRAQIEWFVGPHTIHGKGTFAFLNQWLNN